MSKSVVINNVVYSDVPSVEIPLSSGNGNAVFYDTDIPSGGAVAGDMRSGTKAYVDGALVQGTVAEKDATDVTVSGKTVTVPAGIYDSSVSKSVADGSVTPTATVSGDEIGDTSSSYPITITPGATVSSGYVSGNQTGTAITKYIQVEEATAYPDTTQQVVNPSSGKLLKKVTVAPVDVSATATAADVLNGKTFFAGSLVRQTGSATVPTVSQDSTTKVLTVA